MSLPTAGGLASRIPAWFVLAGAVLLAYGWTLDSYFASDDFGYVARFSTFPLASWPALFVNDWSGGIWDGVLNELRPIAALAFMVDARLWGGHAGGYHLTNLLLHLACSGLVMTIVFTTTRDRLPAVLAGLLFALHPVQREAVIWITGRVDLLAAAGFLLGFLAFIRYRDDARARWLALAWGAFGFGIFAKESCLVLPVVALLRDGMLPRDRPRSRATFVAPYAGWAVLAAIYTVCRAIAVGLEPGMWLNLADLSFGVDRGLRRAVQYVGAMFLPRDTLTPALESVLPYAGWMTALMAISIAVVIIGAASSPSVRDSTRLRAALFYGVAWPIATTMPLVITYFSLRHLYTATAGFVVGAVLLVAHLVPERRRLAACGAALVSIVVLQSMPGMRLWQDSQARARRISEAVGEIAWRGRPGDVVLLDVPATDQDRWLWAWAHPFAFRPPFQPRDLTRDFIVLTSPDVHRDPDAWPPPQTAARLKAAGGAGWIISSPIGGAVTIQPLSAQQLRRAFDEQPLDAESFERIVAALGGPD